jgi:hypothetical protein
VGGTRPRGCLGGDAARSVADLLTELGPAAAPLHPTLRSFAIRDEQVTTYEPGDIPGIADEQVRTAIQTATDGS